MAALEDRHWWFVGRRRIVATLLQRLRLPSHAEILEAGCGTGGNLAMLNQFGRVSALEPDMDALTHAMHKAHVNLRQGSLPDAIPFAPTSFDLVVALDVLEHVEQDEAALKSLHRMLKPGGQLVITVPAYQWLWSAHDTVHHHKRRYTRYALKKKIKAAGFTLSHAGYINLILFPLVAMLRLCERAGWRTGGQDDRMPPAWLNALLTSCFSVERLWVGRLSMPFGVSLILAATKVSD